jgi:APA family basic amino acid/polyamine antiporter
MASLPFATWMRFLGWLVAGFAIYGFYGYRHSRVGRAARPQA